MSAHTHAAHDAQGVVTVSSSRGPECHAASYYCAKCVNGARRTALNGIILAFWQSQGVARPSCPRTSECPEYAANKRCALGWHARDMVNGGGAWLPMAGQGTVNRADRAEFSHVIPAHGGAYCACNILPESGATNAARPVGTHAPLSASARALLAAWPAYYVANVARKASLARLSA